MIIITTLIIYFFALRAADGKCDKDPNGILRFGPGCDFMCHCKNEEQCDFTTGECTSGCARMWYGPGCQYRDIAEGEYSRHSDNLKPPKFSILANDGDPDTCSSTSDVKSPEKKIIPFWRVWLPTKETLRELIIVTKIEKLEYFNSFSVYVEDVPNDRSKNNTYTSSNSQLCYRHGNAAPQNETIMVQCTSPVVGNQVRIKLAKVRTQLVLCDVRINGGRNLAFGRDTNQSSLGINCEQKQDGCASSKAVDGIEKASSWLECSYTGYANDSWWELDLRREVLISYARILPLRTERHMLRLDVSNSTTGNEETVYDDIEVSSVPKHIFLNKVARYVKLTNPGSQALLTLCEVNIFGDCLEDFCGYDCTDECHCKNATIWDKMSGRCSSGCKEGWRGTNCNVCDGTQCQKTCGHCQSPAKCDKSTGTCLTGCQNGYYPPHCRKECDDGKYGQDCSKSCSINCKNNEVCDKVYGRCQQGCKPGYRGQKCDLECEDGTYGQDCRSSELCDDGKYGTGCLSTCSSNCQSNKACDKVNGRCMAGCKPGYLGENCERNCPGGKYGQDCQSTCSSKCQNNFCDKVNGRCMYGCKPGYQGEKCERKCYKGYYGERCSQRCSNHCFDRDKQCNHVNGTCIGGCTAGWKGSLCKEVCDDGEYGKNCLQRCSLNCKIENVCAKVTGACGQGCKPGYEGATCHRKCRKRLYGESCSQRCSNHCFDRDKQCNHVNGTCIGGCTAGWKGLFCKEVCDDGEYGKNCLQRCSLNCKTENVCAKETGACRQGCKPGYEGATCDRKCNLGLYGDGCRQKCSVHCLGGSEKCNDVNGTCTDGCVAGWKGTLCDKMCDVGEYGKDCLQRCSLNCKIENVCAKETGACREGCKPGYEGASCDRKCNLGSYGDGCRQKCSVHCLGGSEKCNDVNGTCTDGCVAGWKGTLCDKMCDVGEYGKDCLQRCSLNCKIENVCAKETGACREGCKPGYEGASCDRKCNLGSYGDGCRQNCSVHCLGGSEKCNDVNGICTDGCVAGWKGTLCDKRCDDGMYGQNCLQYCSLNCKNEVCNKENGQCLDDCKSGYQGEKCEQTLQEFGNSMAGAVGGVAVLVVFIIILLIVIVVKLRRKRRSRKEESGNTVELSKRRTTLANTDTATSSQEANSTINQPRESKIYSNVISANRSKQSEHAVPVSALMDHVKENVQKILEEFQALPFGMIYPTTVALKPYNRGKNKYKDLYAYDHSRVVLETSGEQGSDYINACFIQGFAKKQAYIAAQGPIETSIDDFWRMIWEKNVDTIAMLTNPVEELKMKCLQYWAVAESSTRFGDFIVCAESETIYAEFTIRNLKVSCGKMPSRIVRQFHFTAWPDKGVPRSAASLLQFWRKIRRNDASKSQPWLVHCSAGIGRTGTFIATDILFDQVKANGYVDVYRCVKDLRDQRVNMVQTKDQYMFLYGLVIENFVHSFVPVSLENFPQVMNDLKEVDPKKRKTKLLLQYEAINEDMSNLSTKNETEDKYAAAKLAGNQKKNRYDDILPPNEFRPFLITNIPNCTNYINAVYVPSYSEIHGFILTQNPMKNTAIDCCRLVFEQEVKVIVTFDDNVKKGVGTYLPANGSIQLGPFRVLKVSDEEKQFYIKKNFTMSYGSEDREITQLAFKGWPTSRIVPNDPRVMLSFIQEVEYNKSVADNKPVIVQCLNGAEKSGLFVVLMNIMERAKLENEVSIPQVIKQLRVRRDQIIPNFEQFKFCHDVLLRFVDGNAMYANI